MLSGKTVRERFQGREENNFFHIETDPVTKNIFGSLGVMSR